jgi:hypothetical protein
MGVILPYEGAEGAANPLRKLELAADVDVVEVAANGLAILSISITSIVCPCPPLKPDLITEEEEEEVEEAPAIGMFMFMFIFIFIGGGGGIMLPILRITEVDGLLDELDGGGG